MVARRPSSALSRSSSLPVRLGGGASPGRRPPGADLLDMLTMRLAASTTAVEGRLQSCKSSPPALLRTLTDTTTKPSLHHGPSTMALLAKESGLCIPPSPRSPPQSPTQKPHMAPGFAPTTPWTMPQGPKSGKPPPLSMPSSTSPSRSPKRRSKSLSTHSFDMLQGKKPILDGDQVVRELRLSPRETAPVFGESSAVEKSPSLRRAPSSAEVMAEHLKRVTGQSELPLSLMSGGKLLLNAGESFRESFLAVDKMLEDQVDCSVSGTTVVMAQIYGRQLTVAWLGDSRAVLGRTDPSGDCIAVELTQDHKPDLPAEKQRILDNFGRVDRLMDNYGVAIGPPRVWLKNAQVLGLAMSRSMGDTLAHTVGVTTEAEVMKYELSSEDRFVILASDGVWEWVMKYELSSEDRFVILASDGVWEWVSNSDAVSIVASSPTTEAGCKKLMMTARSRWLGTDRGSYVDDITCMVIGFTHKRSDTFEMAVEGA
eukprot:SM000487S16647  [mRNA]  locus=s487:5251:8970:+ [translate_table: standard]